MNATRAPAASAFPMNGPASPLSVAIKDGLRAGVVFGILVVFLVLVGFQTIGAELIGDLFKISKSPVAGLTPVMFNMLVFFGLLGLWAGGQGARNTKEGTWVETLAGGLAAGLMTGIWVGALAYISGTLIARGVTIHTYLVEMLPAAIKVFMLGKEPLASAFTHLAFFTVMGLAGAAIARGLFGELIGKRLVGSRRLGLRPVNLWLQRNRMARYGLYAALLIIAFTGPLYIGKYWNYTLGTVGIYVLLGLGLNIVVGLAGLLDLGYVAFFAIGAYSVALLTAPTPHHLLWSFWLALPVGIALAALAGILLGIPVLRMRGDYLAIVTLGFGEIIRTLSRSDLLSSFSGGPRGVPAIAGPTLFGRPFSSEIDFVYLILVAVLIIIFITTRLQHSRVGRAWVAMREDETVARAMGINTLRQKLLAFAIGAAFAGLGGVLFASRNQFTGPEDHNLMVSINVLCVVIVGGMGSIPGVIAGAFALKGLPEMLRELQDYRLMVFGALLVIMMIMRPEGLLPSTRRALEMRAVDEEEELPPEPVHPESTSVPTDANPPDTPDVTITTEVTPLKDEQP